MSLSFVNLHGDAITQAKMDAMRTAGVELATKNGWLEAQVNELTSK